MNSTEKEKTREASSRFPAPSSIEMLTDAPVATMFDNASAIMTIGMMMTSPLVIARLVRITRS